MNKELEEKNTIGYNIEGGVTVWIDELTNCLVDSKTHKKVETFVEKVTSTKELKGCTKKNGWYVNWKDLLKENDVFTLRTSDDELQGLVALTPKPDAAAVYIAWMCAAPHNLGESKKYIGVGGHLFAIAGNASVAAGYDGDVFGFAANKELLEHYVNTFGASPVCLLHQYHFNLYDIKMKPIMEAYDYERKEKSNV